MVHQSSTRSGGPVAMSSSSNPSAFRNVLNTGIRGLSGRLQSYSSSSSSSANSTQHQNYAHSSSASPYQSVFSESLSVEKRLERYSYRLSQIRISPNDVQRVANDPEQFIKLQESLRQQHCITDAFIRQTYYNLIRDRVKDMRPMAQPQQSHQRTIKLTTNDNGHNKSAVSFTGTTASGESINQFEKENYNHFDAVTASVTQSLSFEDDDSMDLQEIDAEYNNTLSSDPNPANTDGMGDNDKNYFSNDNPSPTSVTAITVPTTMLLSSEKCIAPTLLDENDNIYAPEVKHNNCAITTKERGNAGIESEDDDIQSAGDCDDIHMIAEEEDEEDSDDDDNYHREDTSEGQNVLIVSS
jgi:hypothetical protein